jgi:ferredoxin
MTESVMVIFVDAQGKEWPVAARIGASLLQVAHEHAVDLEGACEGSLACSTCHVIVESDHFDALPEASDEENDMLDLAFGLTARSRLGCQIVVTPALAGLRCRLPSATRNISVKTGT